MNYNGIFEELHGKRLLILGGNLWKEAIKEFCSENGIVIVAAGNDPHSGICDIADEYYNVNSTSVAEMKALIREKNIDGVYMGGSEPVISAACKYISDLGMPCYCSAMQWESLQNKTKFKELCKQFDLPVVRRFDLTEVDSASYPVITKPADGCASNGFSVCRNNEELINGYQVAKTCSPTGSVIIEQFVPNDSIVVFYTVSNGKLFFSTLEDKYPVYFEEYGTYVGGFFDFESQLADEFRSKFESKIQALISSLEIQEGNFWIEVFHDENKYFFNEVGFRYGGSGSLYPVDYCRGINQVATDIYFALTGKSKISGFSSLFGSDIPRGKKYAIYPIYLHPGVIKCIRGLEQLRKKTGVLNVLTMKREGNLIPSNGSFGQVAMLIHFIYDNQEELKSMLFSIHESLSVIDDQDQEMVLHLLDIDNLQLRTILQKG